MKEINYKPILLMVLAIVLFIAGLLLAFSDKDTSLVVSTYAAAIFCLIFVFITQFKKFKGLGIEAELWDETQEKAEKLLNNLQNVSQVLAECAYSSVISSGRGYGSIPNSERLEMADSLSKELKNIEIPETIINHSRHHFDRLFVYDILSPICFTIERAIQESLNKNHKVLTCTMTEEKKAPFMEERKKISAEKTEISEILENRENFSDKLNKINNFLDNSFSLDKEKINEIRETHKKDFANFQSYINDKTLKYPEHFFCNKD